MIEREVLELDVLFVGAGPASLAGAVHLQRLLRRYDLNIKAGLFFDFTKRCLYRVFVEIDMSAGGEPFLHLFMPMQ